MLQRTPVKIIITDEMLTDYETLFGRLLPKKLHDFVWDENIEEIYCPKPPIDDIVTELKDYIEFRQQSRAPFDDYYFRVKYYDEKRQKMLLLFIFRGKIYNGYQEYEIRGLCRKKDWSKTAEEKGFIRRWIDTTLCPKNDSDWVMEERMQGKNMNKRELKTITNEEHLRLARTLIADIYSECTRDDLSKITDTEELKSKLKSILRMTQNFELDYASRSYKARQPKKFMSRVLPVEFDLRADVLVERIGEDVKKYKEALGFRKQNGDQVDTGIPYGMSKQVAMDIRRDFALMKKVAKRNPMHQKFFNMVCIQGVTQTDFAKQCGVSKGTSTNIKIAFIKAIAKELETVSAMHLQEISESNTRKYFETVQKIADEAESIAFEKFVLMDDADDDVFDALIEEEYERLEKIHLSKRLQGEQKYAIVKGAIAGKKSIDILDDGSIHSVDVIHQDLPRFNKYDT